MFTISSKPLFTSSFTMTWDSYKEMNHVINGKRFRATSIALTLLLVIVGVVFLLLRYSVYGICLIIGGVLVAAIMSHMWKRTIRRGFENTVTGQIKKTKFSFYEDYFTLVNGLSSSKIAYSDLYRIIEGANNFYLLISKVQTFAVEKNSEGLAGFLREKAAQIEDEAKAAKG